MQKKRMIARCIEGESRERHTYGKISNKGFHTN
jgi:hypothetical protein